MPVYRVCRKSGGAEVYRYTADAAVEWVGMEFDTHDHLGQVRGVSKVASVDRKQ